jgi:hypothetical protein
MTEKPQSAILALSTEDYFNLLSTLMGGAAPPAAEDAPLLARMAKIGIEPGKPFDAGQLAPAVQSTLKDLPQAALTKIADNRSRMGEVVNGWVVSKG